MIGEDVMKMERETAMYFKYKDLAEFEKVYNDPVAMREITTRDLFHKGKPPSWFSIKKFILKNSAPGVMGLC